MADSGPGANRWMVEGATTHPGGEPQGESGGDGGRVVEGADEGDAPRGHVPARAAGRPTAGAGPDPAALRGAQDAGVVGGGGPVGRAAVHDSTVGLWRQADSAPRRRSSPWPTGYQPNGRGRDRAISRSRPRRGCRTV